MSINHHLLVPFVSLILLAVNSSTVYSRTTAYVNDKNGLPVIEDGGRLLLNSNYAFWEKSWKWANVSINMENVGPTKYLARGTNKTLDFNLKSETSRSKGNIEIAFDIQARTDKSGIIGGGIVFNLDKIAVRESKIKPELLPNNTGWKWGDIELIFSAPVKSVEFEKGRKSEIRAFFFKENISKGEFNTTMTLLLPSSIETVPNISQRFGLPATASWVPDKIDWQTFPIDLSFLNELDKPAGKKGFIRAINDKLIFENGEIARFWGTNLTASTLFKTSKLNITKQAKRLSAMGFNLVRLHHHDSPWVNPNIFGDRPTKDTQRISPESLDKIDWWIKSLKDEGIYVWLDLHVQRYLTARDDIFAFEEIDKKKNQKGADLKGFNYVNLTIKNAMKRFNRDYVTHVNNYTKLAYKDDPAIIAMLITNENDITHHFGNALLPNEKVPEHNKIYMAEAEAFADKHGLPVKLTWRSWEYGPSKLFLNDLEHRFDVEMIKDLREAGVKVPIATTSTWGYNPLASLPALATGDIIDVHSYGEVLELEKNPLIASSMTSWMAAGQVANKPMSITEWNISPFPAPDRHVSPLLIASKASHQGWDALMQYAYALSSLNSNQKISNWSAYNDPALLSSLPAAALLFRQNHVKEAETTYYLSFGPALYYEDISPRTSAAIRTVSELGKLVIAMPETSSLPWLEPSIPPKNAIVINNYNNAVIEKLAKSATSDTGELYRNWEDGFYSINTNQSQVVMGWIGDKVVELLDTEFSITTRNATIAVQSLDGYRIRKSNDILITLSSNAVPYKDLKNRDKLPFLTEPVRGKLKINAPPGLVLKYIAENGTLEAFGSKFIDGYYQINLDDLPLTHWLKLSGKP